MADTQEKSTTTEETATTAESQEAVESPPEEEESDLVEGPGSMTAPKATEAIKDDPEDTSSGSSGQETTETAERSEEPVAEESADEPPQGGDGAVSEEEPLEEHPGFVNRILEEAVEAASQDLDIPSGDDVDVDLTDLDEPARTVTSEELQRTEDAQGFTGETFGRTISLDDLEAEEQAYQEDPVYSQFRQLIEKTSIDIREEDIVEGRVLRVDEDDVVIDIGYKSDGIVSRDEFGESIRPGDTVEVYLDRKEDRDGQLVLSKEKAEQVRRWQRVEEIYENEEVIEGTIVRRIKGGMIVELLDGMEAFLPGSQVDARPVRDFDAYLDKRMEFKIVKLNPSNENIVVSHRELIEEELEEQRQEILEQLEVGQVLQGTVKNIVDFGVFIDLGGVDGLLHITDLSWGRVSHPSEIVDLDQELEVVVLDYEEERQRISLGLKQLQPHPWENIGEKYEEGDVVEGKVVSITNYGAFVEIEKGIEGLVHISEMSWTRHIKHPSQMVSLGQLVDVKILNIDEEEKKISLGMKQLEPDPWEGITDRYPPGTVLTGTVRNITNFGVFVEIEPGIDGLVHISDLSWTKKVRHPGDMVDKGQDLDVVILNIDEERKRISLGHKQVKTNPWDQFADAYGEGSDTKGEVVRVEDKGLVVELPLEVEAFVPGSELKNGPRNFQNHYHAGDELELRVIRFDKGRKDIVLSETAKERQEKAQERREEKREKRREERQRRRAVEDYQSRQTPEEEEDEETSGPTTLGELSGLANLRAEMEAAERREAEEQRRETDEAAQAAEETEETVEGDADVEEAVEGDADVEEAEDEDAPSEGEADVAEEEAEDAEVTEGEAEAEIDEPEDAAETSEAPEAQETKAEAADDTEAEEEQSGAEGEAEEPEAAADEDDEDKAGS